MDQFLHYTSEINLSIDGAETLPPSTPLPSSPAQSSKPAEGPKPVKQKKHKSDHEHPFGTTMKCAKLDFGSSAEEDIVAGVPEAKVFHKLDFTNLDNKIITLPSPQQNYAVECPKLTSEIVFYTDKIYKPTTVKFGAHHASTIKSAATVSTMEIREHDVTTSDHSTGSSVTAYEDLEKQASPIAEECVKVIGQVELLDYYSE